MKYIDPGDRVLFPVIISLRAEAAQLLRDMAGEMGTTLDELISALAEDSACDLSRSNEFLDFIMEMCFYYRRGCIYIDVCICSL